MDKWEPFNRIEAYLPKRRVPRRPEEHFAELAKAAISLSDRPDDVTASVRRSFVVLERLLRMMVRDAKSNGAIGIRMESETDTTVISNLHADGRVLVRDRSPHRLFELFVSYLNSRRRGESSIVVNRQYGVAIQFDETTPCNGVTLEFQALTPGHWPGAK